MSLLNDASLVLIPSGYKEDKVYSIIPSDGSGDLDFVRGSDGTRINSLGQVENVCWNLAQYSEDFSNAYWTKNRSTVTTNSTTAPNGTNTADLLTEDSSNGTHEFISIPTVDIQTYSFSIYAKANTRTKIQLVLAGTPFFGGGGNGEASFDLSLATVISAINGATGTIQSVGNGWYRCTISKASTASGSGVLAVRLLDASANASYTGNGTSSAYYWGAQLNVGSTAKPYFPTTDRLNVPRLTYENGCPSLLLEKQSSNIITYSEDLTNAAWLKSNATISANAAISPDGTQNADKLIINNGLTGGYAYRVNSTSATPYTGSFYIKAGGVNYTTFYTNMSGSYEQALINLTNGAITNSTFVNTPKTTSVGNGWYRVEYTVNAGGGPVTIYIDGGATSGGGGYTGNGVDGVYIWGAQVEQSSYATSYIPTTSTSVTRLADSCYKTGISSLIGQTSGAMFCEFNYYDNISGSMELVPMYIGAGAYSDGIYFDIYQDVLYLAIWVSASQQTLINCGALNAGKHKVAVSYTTNNINVYLDGALIGTDNSASIPTMSQLNIGTAGASTTIERYTFNQGLLFKRVLTSQEAIALTTL